jgi:hypothetical protein
MYRQANDLAFVIQLIVITIVALALYLAFSTLVGGINQALSEIPELSSSSTIIISMI